MYMLWVEDYVIQKVCNNIACNSVLQMNAIVFLKVIDHAKNRVL